MTGLRKGFYISKRSEKVYLENIKNNKLFYAKSKGKGAKRFRTRLDAYEYLDANSIDLNHKVIEVR